VLVQRLGEAINKEKNGLGTGGHDWTGLRSAKLGNAAI